MGKILRVPIPAGSTGLSAAFNINGLAITHIEIDGVWAAADLSFQIGADSTTLQNVYTGDSAETQVSVQAAISRTISIPPEVVRQLAGARWMKIRSGLTGAAVNQVGSPTLKLFTVPISELEINAITNNVTVNP